jgi:predicted PurR-regulated permease PerM
MAFNTNESLYSTLTKAITFAAAVIIFLWFLFKAAGVVLLLMFALVLAIVINSPVAKLEKRGMRRGWACLLVFGIILLVIVLLGWLIVPRISDQVTTLVDNLPQYATQMSKNVSAWFSGYPQINREIQEQGINLSQILPSVPKMLMQIGNYSLSIMSMILIAIIFFSMIVYTVTNPRPLLELYFSFFKPEKRASATEALQRASVMLKGWLKGNIYGGTIRAVCTTIFLSIIGVPGAWVWGALALFADLIPRFGFYIMAVPPILVALSVSPMTALWVAIFMIALDEVMADFILPKIRSNTMNIHPVSIMFIVLAMAAVFGFMGVLLAVPITAIIKAYYEAFYMNKLPEDRELETRIDAVLYKKAPADTALK